jgi:heat shock protein HslJ
MDGRSTKCLWPRLKGVDLSRQGLLRNALCAVLLGLTGTVGQASEATPTVAASATAPAFSASASGQRESGGLAGSRWRLVKIMSMDDSVEQPDDPDRYILAFGVDRTVSIVADCNRGSGTWVYEQPSQLRFNSLPGAVDSCRPGSISQSLLTQLPWVRSFVMKDSHLFLATMADGSIIEFEPAPPAEPVATALGEAIRTADPAAVRDAVLSALFSQYARAQQLAVEDAGIDAFAMKLRRGMEAEGRTAAEDLSPEEMVEANRMQREFARSIIEQWKVNRALYEQYGGRIIFQQLGPEPLDAYREFLEEKRREGAFEINDPE